MAQKIQNQDYLKKIAFPGTLAGLEGELSEHFGHAETFILLEYDEKTNKVESVEILRNVEHEYGQCMRPVMLLKHAGVSAIILKGIGRRPLDGLKQVGIEVYQGRSGTIKDNFAAFIEKELTILNEATCKNGKEH